MYPVPQLPRHKIRNFFRSGRSMRYRKGEIILGAGDEPAGVYYIDKGFIKVYSISRGGEEYVHLVYKSGEIFPLIWAIKNTSYDVFYEPLGDCVLWRVPKKDFLLFTKNNQEACQLLLVQLAEQLNIHINRVNNLEYKQAGERVAYRLLTLSNRFGHKYDGKVIMDIPFTHQLIADSINLSRESVSRAIEKLEKKNIVNYSEHKIIINDIQKLAQEFD